MDDTNWKQFERVPLLTVDSDSPLAFQLMDVDYVQEMENVRFRVYGVTADGHSVCCSVHDYVPYFYVQIPDSYRSDQTLNYVNEINTRVKRSPSFRFGDFGTIRRIEEVRGANMMDFNEHMDARFLKVFLRHPTLSFHCKSRAFRSIGVFVFFGQTAIQEQFGQKLQFYESNIDLELRFMNDLNMVGCGWVECRGSHYTPTTDRETTCQIEISTTSNGLTAYKPDGDSWSAIAPVRTLSFDIECAAAQSDRFPVATEDPVIQIGCCCQTLGVGGPFARVCFVLGGCSPIDGVRVVECRDESEMLKKWSQFVRAIDPDIITGYNITAFDFPYLVDRLKSLKNVQLQKEVLETIGRAAKSPCVVRDVWKTSKEKGTRSYKQVRINGRIILDVYWAIRRDHTLRSYTLNNVSNHFLHEQKEDLEYKNIPVLHRGSDDDRRRLAIYCLKDAELPLRLLEKLMIIVNNVEMARVTGVLLTLLVTQGQQIRIVFQLLRKAKSLNYFFPAVDRAGLNEPCEGGLVLDPERGYYLQPITVLDFASLYPTIMIAHNICYTTLIPEPLPGYVENVDYIRAPSGFFFATPARKRGILPQIMEDLLAARTRAKRELNETADPFKKMVLNGRQLALKISANSIYGFTGAQQGRLYSRELCQSVTAFGRQMIEKTKELVEQDFKSTSAGSSHRRTVPRVLYGDTDSVMVDFGVKDVAEAMEVGKQAARFISSLCPRPLELKFEKVYCPFLLIQKKRYAGVLYSDSPERADKIETKGLETIRRDNCPLVGSVMNKCMELMLLKKDPQAAIEFAKSVIADLLENRIDISQLIITKELRKTNDQYKHDQPHAMVAELIRSRGSGAAPVLGDRIPFVYVVRGQNALARERAEDPTFAIENRLPIDTEFYLRTQLLNPLVRLFDPVANEEAEKWLLEGKSGRVYASPVSTTVGIGRYAVKKRETCLDCRCLVRGHPAPPLCIFCEPKLSQILTRRMGEHQEVESRFAAFWSECQNCARDFTNKIECGAKDCAIYYAREKARTDLDESTKTVSRFANYYERYESKQEVIVIED